MADNEIYSDKITKGTRTYFFDIKKSENGDLYLKISESKKTVSTHQIIPVRIYNGSKFLYGIPFIKSGSSLMYCKWTIQK